MIIGAEKDTELGKLTKQVDANERKELMKSWIVKEEVPHFIFAKTKGHRNSTHIRKSAFDLFS